MDLMIIIMVVTTFAENVGDSINVSVLSDVACIKIVGNVVGDLLDFDIGVFNFDEAGRDGREEDSRGSEENKRELHF
jgi:hypothetical protein